LRETSSQTRGGDKKKVKHLNAEVQGPQTLKVRKDANPTEAWDKKRRRNNAPPEKLMGRE